MWRSKIPPTFDEGYGGKPDFVRRLDLSGVR